MNDSVLVLNANYEPLNVCSMKRAVGLMMTGKAEMLVDGPGGIQTPSMTYPRPSIVRLAYMVNRPRPRVKLTKREIFRRDGYRCQYCGSKHNLTIDHVFPRHRGGQHTWDNVVTACASCNRRKGGRTPEEANMALAKPVREPSPSAEYLFGKLIDERSEWATYIRGW
ncbi:MAG: HNH endonuclease [Chloroflexi bacterium]|nr:HNH endonuclease [Chloroflexota bacterium]